LFASSLFQLLVRARAPTLVPGEKRALGFTFPPRLFEAVEEPSLVFHSALPACPSSAVYPEDCEAVTISNLLLSGAAVRQRAEAHWYLIQQ